MSTLTPALPQTSDRRLLTWMFIMNAALLTCYAGFMVIFIPDQAQQIDPANKVANLALVMTAASIGAIIIHPLIGAFSDRTRSRFGRRAPWMVISAATAALMMVLRHLHERHSALMNEVPPKAEAAAKDRGILNIATTLPQAMTPVIVWALIAVTGSYTAVFIAGIIFALAGALSVIPIRSVR